MVFTPPPGLQPPPPALAGIVGNSKKLAITMSLDRDTYFVGEVVRLSMKAVNPTAQIIENATVVIDAIGKAKPATFKGSNYIKTVALSSSMSPGVHVAAAEFSKY